MANKEIKISFDYSRLDYVLSQKKIKKNVICKIVGRSDETRKKWKSENRIVPAQLDTIAKYLNVSIDWLRGNDLRKKTKIPPQEGDYVTDPEGFIIPPYSKVSMYSINADRKAEEELFHNWLSESLLFDYVNEELAKSGNKTISKNKFNQFMDSYEWTFRGDALLYIAKSASDLIVRLKKN